MTDRTQPEESARRIPLVALPRIALSVVWASEPGRLGEVLLPPPRVDVVFGRGGPRPDDPALRLSLVRQRPGLTTPTEPLEIQSMSRVQLALRLDGALSVERRGQLRLLHNGDDVERCVVVPGDVLMVGQQLALLAVERPATLPGTLEQGHPFGTVDAHGLVGESPATWALRATIAFVAARSGHVLVLGGSGTGKELVAQALHAQSMRSGRPLVARNAATIPEGLVDAELFGNLRGYPNPGMPDRPGLVGRAHGSTLFLDELAELSPAVQAHLLRVLDSGEYQRLGEAEMRRSDFRLVGATNRPASSLKEDVAARFLLRIETPALDERREDVPLLVRHSFDEIAARDGNAAARFVAPSGAPRIDGKWMSALVRRSYATNVRELHGLVWAALERSQGDTLGHGVEVDALVRPPSVRPVGEPAAIEGALTAEAVKRALDEHNGNIERTAKALGMANRYVLRRLIQKLDLEITRRPR